MQNQSNNGLLRRALAIFGRGILLGLGFGISIGAIIYVSQMVEWRRVATRPDVVSRPEADFNDLALSNLEEHKEGSRDWIVGAVTNGGKEPVHGVQIEVDLFKGSKFVDQYSTHVSGPLKPGESRNFKITCGCRDEAPADHDSFKARVTSRY